MKYIFYDTETTGLEPAFDQILQFAALEADEDLNEVDTINIRCRILPYIVPSPGALLVTKVSPKDLVSSNYSHLQMIYEIRNWITKKCPCIFIGHNSIKFDEDFLRHAFYKTLHPLYLTNTDGNMRGDTLRIAQAASIFVPGSINVPLSEKGKPSFKLGDVARANDIDLKEEDAHDALADVRATLELARLLKRRVPEIWDQMLHNASKKAALSFMRSNPAFCLAEFNFGKSASYVVSAITPNPKQDSEMAVFDLSCNPSDYLDCSVEEILAVMKGKGKEKAIRIVAANKQPIMLDTSIGHSILEEKSIDPELLAKLVQQIQAATEFKQRVATALTMQYQDEEAPTHTEKMIYQGFAPQSDVALMAKFHAASVEERVSICNRFSDARYREMASKLMYAECPDQMEQSERIKIEGQFRDRLLATEEKLPWLTIPQAIKELEKLREEGKQLDLLAEIEAFIEGMRLRFSMM